LETVLQYEIPVLHPVAVHFPIGLLVGALAVALVWVVTGRSVWRRVLAVLTVAGTAGAAIAYLTGESMEEFSRDVPIVEDLIGLHETLALTTLLTAMAMSLVVCLMEWRRRSESPGGIDSLTLRFAVFAGVLVVACLVLLTGHVGGVMVWGVVR